MEESHGHEVRQRDRDRDRSMDQWRFDAVAKDGRRNQGAGAPPPACDVYLAERSHVVIEPSGVRFERIRWYIKIGIHSSGQLFVESFHP
jgi:hypothetical protein